MIIHPNDTILFIGDSITDCGRVREDAKNMGHGYAALAAARLEAQLASPLLKIYNRGISGNRIYDIESRVEADILALQPTIVSILIGINDVWRRYDSNVPSPAKEFAASYSRILKRVAELDAQVVLLEPFLLPVPDDRRAWREDLDPKITVVRDLAVEFGCELIPLDGIFAEAATRAPASYWLPDGVHPSAAGNSLIAESWLERAEII